MLKSIRSKLIFFLLLLIIPVITVPVFVMIRELDHNFYERSRMLTNLTIELVRSNLFQAMRSGDHSKLEPILLELGGNEGIKHIRILGTDGCIHYSTVPGESGKFLQEADPDHFELKELASDSLQILRKLKSFKYHERLLNEPRCQECHKKQDTVLGYFDMDAHFTESESHFQTSERHTIYLGISVAIFLITGTLLIFRNLVTKPLLILSGGLQHVANGNLDYQLEIQRRDEIGQLSVFFNEMVKKLKKNQQDIEQFHFEQIAQADKLSTLGVLSAQMAHEINNPAGIILTRAESLLIDCRQSHNEPEHIQDLETIIRQISRISDFTKNILRFGKKEPFRSQETNVQEILEESLSMLQLKLKKENIRLVRFFYSNNPVIKADPRQINQVFTNLLTNAIDSMDGGGTLSITIKDENGGLQVAFTDTGQGIAEEEKSKIFLPFYTTKQGDRGTGLGLFIVQTICREYNAGLSVVSAPGRGTTFTINFLSVVKQIW